MEHSMKVPVPGCMEQARPLTSRILIAICVAFLLAGCAQQPPPEQRSVYTLSARPLYPEALQIARAWRPDAYLVSIDVPADRVGGSMSLWASFCFLSPSSDIVMLDVTYDSAVHSWQDTWLSAYWVDRDLYPEIADSEWQIDSAEALKVANLYGGADFTMKYPTGYLDVDLLLEKEQIEGRSRAVWSVRYSAHFEAELCVVVDAVTGEVVGKQCKYPRG
jgi:hypothetical protein